MVVADASKLGRELNGGGIQTSEEAISPSSDSSEGAQLCSFRMCWKKLETRTNGHSPGGGPLLAMLSVTVNKDKSLVLPPAF